MKTIYIYIILLQSFHMTQKLLKEVVHHVISDFSLLWMLENGWTLN